MRQYTSKSRMIELTRWIKKNKNATFHDFVKETGGTDSQFYYIRDRLGWSKKKGPRKQAEKSQKPMTVVKEEVTQPLTPKDEVITEGITPDFIWYEMDLMQRKLNDIISRMAHFTKVSQNRDMEQKKMLQGLIKENSEVRVENNSLKQQIAELTEMINGTTV